MQSKFAFKNKSFFFTRISGFAPTNATPKNLLFFFRVNENFDVRCTCSAAIFWWKTFGYRHFHYSSRSPLWTVAKKNQAFKCNRGTHETNCVRKKNKINDFYSVNCKICILISCIYSNSYSDFFSLWSEMFAKWTTLICIHIWILLMNKLIQFFGSIKNRFAWTSC